MTTDPPATNSTTSALRWWRDWLLCSLLAVFLLSLVAAHLPPPLTKIVVFPIGFGIVCGLGIRKCADIAGYAPAHSRRWLQWLTVVCLLLAGFAHVYWIVFNRYLDEAREAIADQADERQKKEQIAAAIAGQGHELDDAGRAALLQPLPRLPTFGDYLQRRLQSKYIPRLITPHPWPTVVFGLEIAIAVWLGARIALEGMPGVKGPIPRQPHPPDATTS